MRGVLGGWLEDCADPTVSVDAHIAGERAYCASHRVTPEAGVQVQLSSL